METNLYSLIMKKDYHASINDYKNSDEYIKIVEEKINEKWSLYRNAVYFNSRNNDQVVPEQGWKIHVSATLSNARAIIDIVSDICIKNTTSFKFMLDSGILSFSSDKNYPRGSSGKFITIYPSDVSSFKLLMNELYEALKGFEGPYILSDKRFKADCKVLYYRYGGIKGNYILKHDGNRSYILKSPNNRYQVDSRKPIFALPDWVEDPFPNENEEEKAVPSLKNGRYTILESFSFNNSGGIYLAFDKERNEKVVIKEARPYTLQRKFGKFDARNIKQKELNILTLLEGEDISPQVIDSFYEWEHYFIVVSFIEGKLLREYIVERAVFSNPNLPEKDTNVFLNKLEIIWRNIINNLSILHKKNIYFCDFHLGNFIITDDLNVIFIDLDGAVEIGDTSSNIMYSKGYIDPLFLENKTYSLKTELYGLGSLLFSTLSTYNNVLDLHPGFVNEFLGKMQKEINLPYKYIHIIQSLMNDNPEERMNLDEVLRNLNDEGDRNIILSNRMSTSNHLLSSEDNIKHVIKDITRYITTTANKENNDYLFYTDPKIVNPLNVENGALGVLYALNKINGNNGNEYMDWIKKQEVSIESYAPSLYLGLSGIGWVLHQLGEEEYAYHIMNLANSHPLKHDSNDIYTGTAGIGLTNLFFWKETNNQTYLDEAVKAGNHLLESAHVTDNNTMFWSNPDGLTYIGHAKGASGIAVFFMYLYKITKDTNYLIASKRALEHDLSYAIDKSSFISFPAKTEGGISHSPYWLAGSAGVAAALMRYQSITKENEYDPIIKNILNDSRRIYTLFPGLFNGLAGLGNVLLDAEQFLAEKDVYRGYALKVADSLNMFLMKKKDGLAFPGDYLHVINNDFGSGASGIALFLNRLVNQENNFNFYLDDILQDS
ncbi:class III lanthionine synthetase LanKC [Paucisalibacillus globulus]|uniref:class III lanthionine synthetase LanKC n=1 Tax=Paucisalibacillus globulus TaxID=351095 RepID=UPI0004268C03|nr:class III lanthionine synthetase LanKC [Paucisalibacillus globulus]